MSSKDCPSHSQLKYNEDCVFVAIKYFRFQFPFVMLFFLMIATITTLFNEAGVRENSFIHFFFGQSLYISLYLVIQNLRLLVQIIYFTVCYHKVSLLELLLYFSN